MAREISPWGSLIGSCHTGLEVEGPEGAQSYLGVGVSLDSMRPDS